MLNKTMTLTSTTDQYGYKLTYDSWHGLELCNISKFEKGEWVSQRNVQLDKEPENEKQLVDICVLVCQYKALENEWWH